MFFNVIFNGTRHISVSYSVAYVLIKTYMVLKTFSYTVCLNFYPVVQRCIGIIVFLYNTLYAEDISRKIKVKTKYLRHDPFISFRAFGNLSYCQ